MQTTLARRTAASSRAHARKTRTPSLEGALGMLAALVIVLAVPASAVRAEVVEADAERIAEVTVYPDRAEVVREVTLRLPQGNSTVVFSNIPAGIEADSLRVSGHGVSAVLGTVELGQRVEEPETPADLAAATAEIERIQHEIAALEAEETVASAMRDYLSTVKTVSTDKSREKLADGKPDPAAIGAMYELLRARLQEQGREGLLRRIRREKLDKEMIVAQQRFNAARPAPALTTRIASVEVDAARAGSLTLRLSYFAPGASWRPTYRATLDPKTGKVELVSEAVVRQATGEDWTGVSLHLSTAAPARGVVPPVLSSWMLRPQLLSAALRRNEAAKGDTTTMFSDTFVENLPLAGRPYTDLLILAPGVNGGGDPNVHGSRERDLQGTIDGGSNVDPLTGTFRSNINPDAIEDVERVTVGLGGFAASPPPAPIPSTAASVSVVRSSYTVTFDVPGRAEVPGDGHEHRVVLRGEDLESTIEYRALPSLQPAAFLIARTHAPSDYPLLAGVVRVFTDGAYLGAYSLAETAPGVELRIPFGVDNRIKVERAVNPQARTREGFTGHDRKVAFSYRTTIENLGEHAIELVVEDRLPVSEDDRIEVERGKAMTAGSRDVKDRPGIVEWMVPLAPREKRELLTEYTVRVPKEIVLAGM